MAEKQKHSINMGEIGIVFYFLFLTSLFFPVRYVFPNQTIFITGAYSDFTSISLYISDAFLGITIFFFIFPYFKEISLESIKKWAKSLNYSYLLIIFLIIWLILGIFSHLPKNSSLNWYFFIKFLELIVAYGTTIIAFQKYNIKTWFFKLFILLSTFESIIALTQFIYQRPLGLYKLGEQLVYPSIQGVAKVIVNGSAYVRGYGTFPHPNLLSAFLTVSLFLCLYLLHFSEKRANKILYSLLFFINLLGLTVTFSRAAFLALLIGLGIWYLIQLIKKIELNKVFWSQGLVIAALLVAFFVFKPFLLTRATFSDQSSLDRIFYAKIGYKMIENRPLFGMGVGESVLHMQQYSPLRLWPWDIQPIHNYFILAAAELGIIGGLILLGIFLSHLIGLWQSGLTTYNLQLITILTSFLILMQFDHYFYTLEQTQMLLWIILGLIATEVNVKILKR